MQHSRKFMKLFATATPTAYLVTWVTLPAVSKQSKEKSDATSNLYLPIPLYVLDIYRSSDTEV